MEKVEKELINETYIKLWRKEGKNEKEIKKALAELWRKKIPTESREEHRNKKDIEAILSESPDKKAKVEKEEEELNQISLGNIETNCQVLPIFSISRSDMQIRKEILFTQKRKNEVRIWKVTKADDTILWPGTFAKNVFWALQQIMIEILKEEGEVKNPISFTFAQICRILKISSGGNYDAIEDAINQIQGLNFSSKDVYYNKKIGKNRGTLTKAKTFYLIPAFGKRDYKSKHGRLIFEKSEIFFDEVFLENINHWYLSKIDVNYALSLPDTAARLYEIFDGWFFSKKKNRKTMPFCQVYYSNLCKQIPTEEKDKICDKKSHFRTSLEKLVKKKFLKKYEFEKKSENRLLIRLWPGEQIKKEAEERGRRVKQFKNILMKKE